ncbi:MAG: long-chain-fatty-acid--CoA ligase [Thermaerobacter sp.]|nr:long-chain-fatty-acid--CoA ligase [Thermaerobacter sp.]
MPVPQTPLRFLRHAERIEPDKTAIVCGSVRLTFREYAHRVRQLTGALSGLGVGRGDRVAYLGLNCHRLLELYYAVPACAAILSPLNVRLTEPELLFILQDLEAKLLVTDRFLKPMAERLAAQFDVRVIYLGADDAPAGWLDYEELLAQATPRDFLAEEIDEQEVAEIFYTSGTTGRPKGVMLTHRNLHQHAMSVIASGPVYPDEVQLVGTVPLFHVNGWGSPQFLVAMAGTQVVTSRFDPEDFFRLVHQERVTLAYLVPTMLAAILNSPLRSQYDLGSLRRITIGGAPPPSAMIREAHDELGVDCSVGYGLSETCPVLSLAVIKETLKTAPEAEQYRLRALTGLPILGAELRVMGEEGEEVAHDGVSVGEIWARGDMISPGYWRRPEETATVFVDGWFHTGDMAVVEPNGYLRIVDRKKDVIISGGENISSVEVEDAIYTHPAVMEAAVVAKPHARWGEVPVAFVVLRPGAALQPEELREHLRGRIANFKIPHEVRILPELPKTGTGKVVKTSLRETAKQA